MTSALVIIDLQKAILAGKGTPERQPVLEAALDAMTARLADLLARAHASATPVILIQHDGDARHRLHKGTEGWRFRDEIAPVDDDIVVHKRFSDGFFETELAAVLTRLGVKHIIIGGCMTQFCVDTTVRSALSRGYDVTLLSDGHTTADAGELTFEQIIAHHNTTLDGFGAGDCVTRLETCRQVRFHAIMSDQTS